MYYDDIFNYFLFASLSKASCLEEISLSYDSAAFNDLPFTAILKVRS